MEKRNFSFVLFCFLLFCFLVSLLLIAFNLENKGFHYILTTFWRSKYESAYENQVCVAQMVPKNIIGISNTFQHDEEMLVFKLRFFIMTFFSFSNRLFSKYFETFKRFADTAESFINCFDFLNLNRGFLLIKSYLC